MRRGLAFALVWLCAAPLQAAQLTRALFEGPSRVSGLRDELAEKVARDPGDAEEWRDLGVCEVRAGDAEAGLRALDRSIELDPREDEWRAAYRLLALERVGRVDEAAGGWEQLAPSFGRFQGRLVARAAALRLWESARGRGPVESARVAMLPPEALDTDPQKLSEALASAMLTGLGFAGLEVLDPNSTTELLARRGRRVDELGDDEGRGRVGRALSQSGVQALVTSSFLVMEDATLVFSVAVLPVTADGVDATRPYQAMAPVARAIEVVPPVVASIASDLGAEGVQADAIAARLPATIGGARAVAEAEQAMRTGDLAAAIAAWSRASAADPSATALAQRVESMRPLEAFVNDPVVMRLDDGAAVVELLVDEAEREHRRKRKFTDN